MTDSLDKILAELEKAKAKDALRTKELSPSKMLSNIYSTVDLTHELMSLTDLYATFHLEKTMEENPNARSVIIPPDFIELNIEERFTCICEKFSQAIDLLRNYMDFVSADTFSDGFEFRIFNEASVLFDHTAFQYEQSRKQIANTDAAKLSVNYDTAICYSKNDAYQKANELLITLKSLVWFSHSLCADVMDINTFSFILLQIHTTASDTIAFLHVVLGIL